MTIDDLGATGADTETPTVTLSSDEAAAIAETYQDADEQRHEMAKQLREMTAKCAAALRTLGTAQNALEAANGEIARLQHQNTELIRQNATLRRESNTLMQKFAKDLQAALGLDDALPELDAELEDEDLDDVDGQADEDEAGR